MHPRFLALALAGLGACGGIGHAQLQSSAPLQSFQGATSQSTAAFMAPDSCEVRWHAMRNLNVAVLAADGTVIAGGAGSRGAVYLPKGGSYHLQLDYDPAPQMPQGAATPQPQAQQQQPQQNSAPYNPITRDNYGDNQQNNQRTPRPGYPPGYTPGQPYTNPAYLAMMNGPYTVEVISATASVDANNMGMPFFKLPGSAAMASTTPAPAPTPAVPGAVPTLAPAIPAPAATPAPVPATPAASPGGLSEDQARAVVLIKGDKAEGTGFLVKTPNGPVVITNIHVIADNPNLKITTNTGALITVLSQKGASDRDLAMLAIKDNGYSYLEMAPDISKVVQPGDPVVTPGNSEGGEVMLNTQGSVLGVGPERIEISNPIYHGNSGGPVFHPKSGKVLGVVTQAEKVELSDDLDKTSFASRNSAISSQMRYFALRLDTVTNWIDIDPRIFNTETTFLDQFEEQSKRLDAYLNRGDGNANANSESPEGSKIYLDDEKIMRAEHNYQSNAGGGDTAQHIEALRSLLFDLQGIADLNVHDIQNMDNFYPFDRTRARDQMSYRKALKDELDSYGNNIERLSHLPRTNN